MTLEVVWCQGWETASVKAQQCAPPQAKDATSAPMPAVVRGRVMSFLRRHQATASQGGDLSSGGAAERGRQSSPVCAGPARGHHGGATGAGAAVERVSRSQEGAVMWLKVLLDLWNLCLVCMSLYMAVPGIGGWRMVGAAWLIVAAINCGAIRQRRAQ